jgi:predicted methyltransferase
MVITKYEKPCDCDMGVIPSPRWQKYFLEEEKLREKYISEGMNTFEADEKAWNELKDQREELELSKEPEELDCPECEGKGVILTDEGKELLSFIRRHL